VSDAPKMGSGSLWRGVACDFAVGFSATKCGFAARQADRGIALSKCVIAVDSIDACLLRRSGSIGRHRRAARRRLPNLADSIN
jgi:hypothetical protein